ncbi:MAG: DUF6702 family protein [Bacteroidota bacterium]|nr:DUF6702 family protein [Bacteroidota bacterium]
MNQLIIKFFYILLFVVIHKYYVSTTLIDFDLKSQTFEITLKVFYDDLEKDLGLDSNVVDYEKDYNYLNKIFKKYLSKNFIIEIENQRIILEYLGYEKKRDQINFYMNLDNDFKNKSINIQNSVLFNSFPDQKNIILFRSGRFRKSLIQDMYNPKDSFNFNNK